MTVLQECANSAQFKEIDEQTLLTLVKSSPIIKKYYQLPVAFDIEASSFRINNIKRACMYIWQMGFYINNVQYYVYGRYWYEWERFIEHLRDITYPYKLIIYVHNLSYEFHWIFRRIEITKVFARRTKHPIYFESDKLVFKCSYFLSNYSLRNLAKNRGYTLKEELDYSKIRTSVTPLTPKELHYCLIDVKIVCEYIYDEMCKNCTIQEIPLTSTGYARRYCYDYICEHENILSYQSKIRNILPTDPELFSLLYTGYTGAFTHANYNHVHLTLENVHCIDYTSSYPAVMCRKRFPMHFTKGNPKRFKLYIEAKKAMIMKVEFTELEAVTNHSILSQHKCTINQIPEFKTIIDNGRVRKAYKLTTVITDLDFEIINKFYTYSSINIILIWVADYRYLPVNLILSILHLYADKTKLKGVIGKEEPYLRSKELINSVYGMSVTNPLNDEIIFNLNYLEWETEEVDIEKGLVEYKNKYKIFTAYQWGVWVTAWARWELLNTVYKIGNDVVYCDTDSIKYLNNHDDIIKDDNKRILEENDKAIEQLGIDKELFYPKTVKGKVKPLGIWDKEDDYKYFKTLGAKRYCFSYTDEHFEKIKDELEPKTNVNFFITVAGLSKEAGKSAIIALSKKHNQSPFDVFSYDNSYTFQIPAEESNKQCFGYINDEYTAEVTDYLGNTTTVHEYSYINSEAIPFEFSATEDYLALLGMISIVTTVGGQFKKTRIRRFI